VLIAFHVWVHSLLTWPLSFAMPLSTQTLPTGTALTVCCGLGTHGLT
jgi:hypothetical protein